MVSRFQTALWSQVSSSIYLLTFLGHLKTIILNAVPNIYPAAVYSARYISERFLPDKAIDLVDEAASSLRLTQESKPDELEALDREIMTLQIELESLKKETDVFSIERRAKVEGDLLVKRQMAEELTALWQAGAFFSLSLPVPW